MAKEVRTVSSSGGEKGSKGERFDLIPVEPLAALSSHYGIGSLKYDDDNWRKGYDWKYSYAALQRHANAWWGGEEWTVEVFVNRETGEEIQVTINHMVAVAWHAFALYWFSIYKREFAAPRFSKGFGPESWMHPAYEPVSTA